MKWHFSIAALLLIFMNGAAQAKETEQPVAFQRETIAIERSHVPDAPALPWQEKGEKPLPLPTRVTLSVSTRPASALKQQEGWFNVGGLQNGSALLFIYNEPQTATIHPATIYAPLDILFINAQGIITDIAPRIILAESQADINSSSQAKAILMLEGGRHESLHISPGDHVESPYFIKPPAILSAP